jgi:hypothetical protein
LPISAFPRLCGLIVVALTGLKFCVTNPKNLFVYGLRVSRCWDEPRILSAETEKWRFRAMFYLGEESCMSKVLFLVVIVLSVGAGVSARSGVNAHTNGDQPSARVAPRVISVGPRTTYLKEGLSTEDVRRLLGKPAAISERNQNGSTVTTYEFPRGEGRVLIVEFVDGALARSRTEIQPPAVPAPQS